MTFYLFGIDYKSASISVREDLYRKREEISAYWESINPGRTAALITCNRIEIYGALEYPHEIENIRHHYRSACSAGGTSAYLIHGGKDVFSHSLRLACGLESELQGEFQILQQLQDWVGKNGFPGELSGLWNETLVTARNIREVSGLGRNVVNVSDAVFDDLAGRLRPTGKKEIMIVGTGRLAELIAERKPKWASITFVARKKRARVRALARAINADILLPDKIRKKLMDTDAVISATSSPHYALRKEHFQGLNRTRKERLRIYDLAMPRDVDPAVVAMEFTEVIGLEDVARRFNRRNGWLRRCLEIAGELTGEAVNEYTKSRKNSYRVAI